MLKKIIHQSGQVVSVKVVTSLNALFLSYLIASKFGATGAGSYFFIISLLSFVTSVSTLGLPISLLAKIPVIELRKEKVVDLLFDSLIISFLASLSAVMVIYFFAILAQHEIILEYFLYIALAIFPFGFVLIVSSYFQSSQKVISAILFLNGGYQIILSCLVFFCTSSVDIEVLFSLFLLSIYALTLFSIFYIFRAQSMLKSLASLKFSRLFSLFKFSLDFMFTNMLGQLSNFFILFVLSIFSVKEDIGFYSVALRIALLVSFVSFAVNRVISPQIAKFFKERREADVFRLISISYLLTSLFVFPFFLLLVFYADFILHYFGSEFIQAKNILIVLISGQLVGALSGINSFVLQMTGNQKIMKTIMLCCALVSTILTLVLVYFSGVIGAAFAYSFNLVLISLASAISVYKILGYSPFKRVTT